MSQIESDSDASSDEGGNAGVISILTVDDMLRQGLTLANYPETWITRVKMETNLSRFRESYGVSPYTCCTLWEALQTTDIEEAKIPASKVNINHYLMSLHFLKHYPTEGEREAKFHVCRRLGRDLCWFYIEKIAALKSEKITWPDHNFGDDIWAITVDGTHFSIQEPQHAEWSQDTTYYSHKLGGAAFNYELGISLSENRLVWMNGPFPAGRNDISIFVQEGLKEKLHSSGKVAIGDLGYSGHAEQVSIPNPSDTQPVKKFKSRALKRHETFNGLIKTFHCMRVTFRHKRDRFKICFEAVAVICQFQIEHEKPLFDVLIDDIHHQSTSY